MNGAANSAANQGMHVSRRVEVFEVVDRSRRPRDPNRSPTKMFAEMESDKPSASTATRYLPHFLIACLTIVSVVSCIAYQRRQVREQIAQQAADRRLEAFNKVKGGADSVMISDPKLISMLASDTTCVSNLTTIYFDMIDIPSTDAEYVDQLKNVSKLSFYDARGADGVVENARDLPIESLNFNVTPLNDSTIGVIAEFPRLQKLRFQQNLPASQLDILSDYPEHIEVLTVQELPQRTDNGGEPSDAHGAGEQRFPNSQSTSPAR